MIFSLIILVLIGVIAYFHYLQGFFSATISAALAVIAALLAIGYHETVANLGNSYIPEYASSAAMAAVFAVSYLVLRLLFDGAVPGNVHFPLAVERIGSAAMGVIAGVFSVGVFAIAAQALPFGPNIAGLCRYPVEFDKKVGIKIGMGAGMSDALYDQLNAEKFLRNESGDASGLLVPADNIVLKLVTLVSREGGSLECGRSFEAIHPDYLQELFGQRVGLQVGSRHSAATTSFGVAGVFMPTGPIPQDDPERWTRDGQTIGIRGTKGLPALPRDFKPGPGKVALVIRARPDNASADAGTGMVAFTPASARLIANRKSYFPLGTLESGRVLYRNAVDDAIFVPSGKAVDLVYEVPEADVLQAGKDKNAAPTIAPDVLLEFKRSARADLGLKPVTKGVTLPGDAVEVVRKEGNPAADMASAIKATLSIKGTPQVSDLLPSKIFINLENGATSRPMPWGRFVLADGRFGQLEVNPVQPLDTMEQGRTTEDRFAIPDGHVMVQIPAAPVGEDKWQWGASLDDYVLEDSSSNKYKPKGAYAKLNNNGQEMMVARYDVQKGANVIPATKNMRPTDVFLLFTVPARSDLRFLYYKGELLQSMQFKAVTQ
jgi:hypothetical protein